MSGSKVASLSSSSSSSQAFLRRGTPSLYRLSSYHQAEREGASSSFESQESFAAPQAAALRKSPQLLRFPPSSSYLTSTPSFLLNEASRNFNPDGSLTRHSLLCILDEAIRVTSEIDFDWDETAIESRMNSDTTTTSSTARQRLQGAKESPDFPQRSNLKDSASATSSATFISSKTSDSTRI
ncbi:hypothetical protein ACA910_004757 [Epithemia clementina (nom. ined.)]